MFQNFNLIFYNTVVTLRESKDFNGTEVDLINVGQDEELIEGAMLFNKSYKDKNDVKKDLAISLTLFFATLILIVLLL